MAHGPGVYDAEVMELLQRLGAGGILLCVSGGDRGHEFAVAVRDPSLLLSLPQALRDMADKIEVDLLLYDVHGTT